MNGSLPFSADPTPDSNSLDYKRIRQSDPHQPNPLNRTKTIGIKVSETLFETLRQIAESQGKPLSEWCRDRITEASAPPGPRPAEFTVLAELTATQAILIDFLCVMGRDGGRLSTPKAQQIVDKAHEHKYREDLELMKLGYDKAPKFRVAMPAGHEAQNEGRTG